MVAIEVKGYADFDIPVTHGIWINPNLPKSFNPATLGDFGDDRDPKRLVKALECAGFTKLSTRAITFGGNY